MANQARIEQFREALRGLLPRGLAWVRRPDGVLDRLLEAIAAELDRVYERAEDLRAEKPATTVELLEQWEAFLKLPDPVNTLAAPQTADQRRNAVVAKLGAPVNQSPGGLEAFAARMGFDVDIVEAGAFVVSDSPNGLPPTGVGAVGDPLNDDTAAHVFYVRGSIDLMHPFRVDISAVGDALEEAGHLPLEAAINQAKPAHSIALFEYS